MIDETYSQDHELREIVKEIRKSLDKALIKPDFKKQKKDETKMQLPYAQNKSHES